jgi:spore coat polysaccharide biosynthesis protein SpsF
MKVVAIIPARMDSSRLPRKHLKVIDGNEMLYYLYKRLNKVKKISDIILATTKRSIDDPLINWADNNGLSIYRGENHDLLKRFFGAAKKTQADVIIRANGDSPLIAPEILSKGIIEMQVKKYDFLTGKTFYTGFPTGIGGEIIQFHALETLNNIATKKIYREHVTNYIFDNPKSFYWSPMPTKNSWIAPKLRLVVDSEDDYVRMIKIIKFLKTNISNDPAGWSVKKIILSYNKLFNSSGEIYKNVKNKNENRQ